MKMYEQLSAYLKSSGLLGDALIQSLIWRDKGKDYQYVVFRPDGGSNLNSMLGNEYHVLIDFIAPENNTERANDLVHNIVDYIVNHQFDVCLGLIQVVGNIPSPVTTADKRIVYRLLVSIKHGN